jgi:hypothetical protein
VTLVAEFEVHDLENCLESGVLARYLVNVDVGIGLQGAADHLRLRIFLLLWCLSVWPFILSMLNLIIGCLRVQGQLRKLYHDASVLHLLEELVVGLILEDRLGDSDVFEVDLIVILNLIIIYLPKERETRILSLKLRVMLKMISEI